MIEIVVLIISVAVLMVLGFIVLFSDKANLPNQLFLALTTTFSIWSILTYWSIHPYLLSQLSIVRLVMLAASIQILLAYLSVSNFPNKNKYTDRQKGVTFYALIVSFLTLTPLLFSSISEKNGMVTTTVGPAIILFGGLVFVCIGGSIYISYNNYKTSTGNEKPQHKTILLGLAITFSLMLTFNLILTLLYQDISFIGYGPAFTVVFSSFYAYGMMRYKLYSIRPAVVRSFAYIISLSLSLLAPILLAVSLVDAGSGASSTVSRVTLYSATMILAMITYLPLKQWFDARTDKFFLRQTAQLNAERSKLKQEVGAATYRISKKNKALRVKNRTKDDFISLASHQLRTPLSVASMNNKMLIDGMFGKLSKRQAQAITDSQDNVARMGKIIEELLDAARIDDGSFELHSKKFDIAKLVSLISSNHLKSANSKSVEISVSVPTKLTVVGDELKLGEVISNLIDNAIKYSSVGTDIEVSLKKDGKQAALIVVDSGVGIPKSEQKYIFNKFGRTRHSKKHSPDGMGLGLFLARKTVEAHEGEIIFKSRSGKGSTFGFKIPTV